MKAEGRRQKAEGGVRAGRRRSGYPLSARGFTMIEIAISLAVIGFALVAIIGILPTGMQTQKNNRQETIINQDLTMFLDGIRNGEQGLDDLTNYVAGISIVRYRCAPGSTTLVATNWYSYTASDTPLLLTNGMHIIGLLSTPKYITLGPVKQGVLGYLSNHVVAYVRSVSGPAAEKTPATYSGNPLQDLTFNLGFNYRLVPDVVPYFGYDTNGNAVAGLQPNGLPAGVPAGPPPANKDSVAFTQNLQANLHEVRLTFRWPLLPDGSAGPGYQTFRAPAAGTLTWTNEFFANSSWPTATTNIALNAWSTALFFFQPRTFLPVTP